MARKPNEKESKIISTDAHYLRQYLLSINRIFPSGVQVLVKDQNTLGQACGEAKSGGPIILSEDLFNNDIKRADVFYHEMGHRLFGRKRDAEQAKKILGLLTSVVKSYPDNFSIENPYYGWGIAALEEYLVETFSHKVCASRGIEFETRGPLKHPGVCADYEFYAKFRSNYGIFEEHCRRLVTKLFGSDDEAISQAFDGEFFTRFLEVEDKVSMMQILENLGRIHIAMRSYSNYAHEEYNPQEIQSLLEETMEMIDTLKLGRHRT